ncbi:hypothetical protein [Desulfosporosinus sp. SB140]|uniref:hypothetical protein n=1 Tax=Desulfosporosinus paludis TaxID=3115649 RepID=UPI00388FE7B3
MFDAVVERKSLLELPGEEVQQVLEEVFPQRQLYSHSLGWRDNPDYFLKARGTHGDALIGWEEWKGWDKDELARSLYSQSLKSILGHRQEERRSNSGPSKNRK